jgi:hypothetical protein
LRKLRLVGFVSKTSCTGLPKSFRALTSRGEIQFFRSASIAD